MKLTVKLEQWPLKVPFRITGYTWEFLDVVLVTLDQDGKVGRGEAAGVYYKNDKPEGMVRQIEAVRKAIESGLTREAAQNCCPLVAHAMRSTARCGILRQNSPDGRCGSWPGSNSRIPC